MRRGLTGRMVVASGLLAIVVVAAFAALLVAITNLQGATDLRRETREELVAAEELEKLIIDLEKGLRGFVITGEERYLEPWRQARSALPEASRTLEVLTADEPVQLARARRIVRATGSYIRRYALPLIEAVRRNDPTARSVETTDAGKSRIDALRASFDRFAEAGRARLSAREADADEAARRATVAAAAGIAGSILLILVFTGYLTRVIVQPLRRAALMADRLAGGDLRARMVETDVAEIGALGRSFNVMAGSLEKSRDELASLLAEQQALRRVATLVARGIAPADTFAATAVEVGRLLAADATALCRYELGKTVTLVAFDANFDLGVGVGARLPLEGENVMGDVLRGRRAARRDSFEGTTGPVAEIARLGEIRSAVGAPIVVEGRIWGVIVVSSRTVLPDNTEQRLVDFTDLVATAIANAESRGALGRVSNEQAALRRVATLVARGVSSARVFEAVTREVGLLSGADLARMERYESDGTVTGVAGWSRDGEQRLVVGERFALEGESIAALVRETNSPTRVDSFAAASGPIAQEARAMGIRASVGCPIVVQGRLWGVIAASSRTDVPFPPDTEAQIGEFTELVATAIANAESRAALAASRARIVTTADATRRRIERDLHDGAQQHIVSLALELRAAQASVPAELHEHRAELARAVEGLTSVLEELREIGRGIHPAILAQGGLGAALKTLANRSAVPVELDVRAERLPEAVEVAAYYVVSEALTNATRYAQASVVHVAVEARDRTLSVSVRDDGKGGADPEGGSGLLGLKDRAEAMGGSLYLDSPLGAGTSLHVEFPFDTPAGEPHDVASGDGARGR